MRYSYFYVLVDPEQPVKSDFSNYMSDNGWRLHSMVPLPSGQVFIAFEKGIQL